MTEPNTEDKPNSESDLNPATILVIISLSDDLLKKGYVRKIMHLAETRVFFRLSPNLMLKITNSKVLNSTGGVINLAFRELGEADNGEKFETDTHYSVARKNKYGPPSIEKIITSLTQSDVDKFRIGNELGIIDDPDEEEITRVWDEVEEEKKMGLFQIEESEARELVERLKKIDPEKNRISQSEFYETYL